METKYHKSSRGYWFFIDGKHKKTFQKQYLTAFSENTDKIDFSKKRLSPTEKEMLDKWYFYEYYSEYENALQRNEPLVYNLVKNSKITGVRFVESKTGNRYELCYDNGIKIKISKAIYSMFPVKLEKAFLNY